MTVDIDAMCVSKIFYVLLQFIQYITIIIDEAISEDHRRLKKILEAYHPEKNGSCYKVKGTYEELENLEVKLSGMKQGSHKASSQQVEPVAVSSFVMSYIQQKCKNELSKILGKYFEIEEHYDKKNPKNTVNVTFRQRHDSTHHASAACVRQRFITFYQRTASDLEVTSVSLGSLDHKELEKRFRQLLFQPRHDKCEVTGNFMHIARLKEFLLQVQGGSPVSTTSHNSSSLLPHNKDPDDESCPICMEPIDPTKKKTLRCKHSFCKQCLKKAFEYKPVCPTCGEIYSALTGTQPDGGRMAVSHSSSSLPGYERYGTIIIHYSIPSGIQKVRLQIQYCNKFHL